MLRFALLPPEEDTADERTMDVETETGHPGVGPTAVAAKQAGLLPFQGGGPAAGQALPLGLAAAP